MWRTLGTSIKQYARGAFSADELTALRASWRLSDPSIEDVPLIDELRFLLGEVLADLDNEFDNPKQLISFERRERDDRDYRLKSTQSIDDDGFAHVLVDEAQDLSPMQWRMLGWRGRFASWTIIGDEAQSSWPHPAEAAVARAKAPAAAGRARARPRREGVILGCTEIELLVEQSHVAAPVFPTTLLHVRAAVNAAVAG